MTMVSRRLVGPCQPEREVATASAANKKENGQGIREFLFKPESIFDDVVMEVAGVGVEHGHLFLRGPDDPGMAMPDMGNVVDGVQVRLSVLII
jgi:hypothetical protein